MSMMFWGLTVPGTGRLDSLPDELKASLRYECPPLPIAPFFRPMLDTGPLARNGPTRTPCPRLPVRLP